MRTTWSQGLVLLVVAVFSCSNESLELEDSVITTTQALTHHPPRVTLADGVVRGERRDGSRVFIGIPYAAAPVGELRWKPPMPVEPWDGVLDATGPGRTCIQLDSGAPTEPSDAMSGSLEATEDCLQLNVFAPERKPVQPVPVMVWLHGGGNATGSANDQLAPGVSIYDGARLRAAAPRDVVVVSVNYRLGPLGFLAHPALSEESRKHVSGNYGLLDQQAALRWVQRNIAAFGGDPKNVTLFGESAGSFDTCFQAVLKGSGKLFHGMIMESGSCTMNIKTLDEGEQEGASFAQRLGCEGDDTSVLDCLRAKPADAVQRRDLAAYPGSPFFANLDSEHEMQWGEMDSGLFAVVDGVYLMEQPIAAFAAGRYARVPAIIGTTSTETAYWYVDGEGLFVDAHQYRAAINGTFEESAHAIRRRYAVNRYDSVNDAAIALTSDFFFVCPAWQLARRMSQYSDVYMYNWTRGANTPDYQKYGPAHSVDLFWVWDIWSAAFEDRDAEMPLVTQTADYWTALAESGDPNLEGSPNWPKYIAGEDQELNINLDPDVGLGRRDARCALWSKVFAEQWGDDWAED